MSGNIPALEKNNCRGGSPHAGQPGFQLASAEYLSIGRFKRLLQTLQGISAAVKISAADHRSGQGTGCLPASRSSHAVSYDQQAPARVEEVQILRPDEIHRILVFRPMHSDVCFLSNLNLHRRINGAASIRHAHPLLIQAPVLSLRTGWHQFFHRSPYFHGRDKFVFESSRAKF